MTKRKLLRIQEQPVFPRMLWIIYDSILNETTRGDKNPTGKFTDKELGVSHTTMAKDSSVNIFLFEIELESRSLFIFTK